MDCYHSPKSSARCRIHPKQFVVICAIVWTLHHDPARAIPLLSQRARAIEAGLKEFAHRPDIVVAEANHTLETAVHYRGYSAFASDSEGRTIWIADAHRGRGKRYVVCADEKLSAFVELERQVLTVTFYRASIHADSCR